MTKPNQTKQAFLLFLIMTNGEDYVLQTYAELLGVTRERVRQMTEKFLEQGYIERVS
jgi:DNA-directed RNA polymerase sigma subunit (sigma70/sigma32)